MAGEGVEVGSAVTRFRVGDRVLGHAVGTDRDSSRAAEGGFQTYSVLLERMAAPIPDTWTYASACVPPLGLSTAACSLFQTDQLALRHPSAHAQPTGQTVLVWGGSSSVGSKAIHGRTLAGAVSIGTGSSEKCADVVRHCTGRKFVSIASTPVSFATVADEDRSRLELPRLLAQVVTGTVALQITSRLRRTSTRFITGTTLKTYEVCTAIYQDFLADALAQGRYVAAPEPDIVGQDLGDIQHAIDIQRQGVSAKKVVVTLPNEPSE